MATLWNKTLFYLGLVDEDEVGPEHVDSAAGEVRAIDSPPLGDAPFQGQQAPQPQANPGGQTVGGVRPPGALAGRRIEPPSAGRRLISSDPVHAEAGLYVYPSGAEPSTSEMASRRMEPESQIIVARNFSDAQSLADAIRGGRGVVLDLRSTEPEMVRRIVDFASGLTYALDGKMSKTAQGVILVTPSGVTLGVSEQERLGRLGLLGGDQ